MVLVTATKVKVRERKREDVYWQRYGRERRLKGVSENAIRSTEWCTLYTLTLYNDLSDFPTLCVWN